MKKFFFVIALAACLVLLFTTPGPASPFIYGPYPGIVDDDLIVGLAIGNPDELESTIVTGIAKEIIYTIELLRVWKFWPDEFIVSKKISRTVKYDYLREHYRITSRDGVKQTESVIMDRDALRAWFFDVKKINLVNIRELSPGSYYIRAIVESRSIEQLPVIGFITHFIPESIMTLAKESEPFMVEETIEKP